MKIVITGAKAEGKSRLLEVIRRRVLDDYGAEVKIMDGGLKGPAEFIQGGFPTIDVLVTNDTEEAIRFLKENK